MKPPQKPTMRRKRRLLLPQKSPAKSPMQKHPSKLMVKVATGNGIFTKRVVKAEIKKRIMLPVAPPNPTNMICFIMNQR